VIESLSFLRRRESREGQSLGPRFPFGIPSGMLTAMRSAIRGGDTRKNSSFPRKRESRESQTLGPRLPSGMRSAIRGGGTSRTCRLLGAAAV